MSLDERRIAYKDFFVANEYGASLLKQLKDIADKNLAEARKNNSLDHLSRNTGNMQAISAIEDVLKGGASK